jgi:hypothetical protein
LSSKNEIVVPPPLARYSTTTSFRDACALPARSIAK